MKAKPWKTIHSTDIVNHPHIHLVEDTVVLPDGKTTTYIKYAPTAARSVAIIAINKKQEVLLQKEYSYPPNIVMWQLPGGKIKKDEDILVAANRELSEESGFIAKSAKVIGGYFVSNRRSDEKQYVVLAADLAPQSGQADSEEFIETHWIATANLQHMIAKGEFNNINLLAALNIWFSLRAGD